ncbi:MAG: cbb3-type cytochrome c oxidase N-terminal domain-containing protein [Blastocatellia bacterium]
MSEQGQDKLLEGHDADGIREFDNDMPFWLWLMFVLTIWVAVLYFSNYHIAFGPSTTQEYQAEVDEYLRVHDPAALAAREAAVVVNVEPLTDFTSLDRGRILFQSPANNCFTCHRMDLGGQIGPNLTDQYWMHGCDLPTIMKNIRTGFPAKGMLPYGTGKKLSEREVLEVASFILSKKDSNPPTPKPLDPARDLDCSGDKTPETAEAKTEAKPVAGEEKKQHKSTPKTKG